MCEITVLDNLPACSQSVNIVTSMDISHFDCKLRVDTSAW